MKHFKKLLLFISLTLFSYSGLLFSQSQLSDSIQCKPLIDTLTHTEFYFIVDSMPEYPGGKNEMMKFFLNNFKYPPEIDACCSIYVEFIIDKRGKMTNLKILRGLQEDFDKETLRVFEMMPDWKPGKLNGVPVNVKYTIPIRISFQ